MTGLGKIWFASPLLHSFYTLMHQDMIVIYWEKLQRPLNDHLSYIYL